jgi:hypothetical protein
LAQHVAALVKKLHPNTPVRELERRAVLRYGAISRHCKPSGSGFPSPANLRAVADALGCEEFLLMAYFCLDANILGDPPLSDAEHKALRRIQAAHPPRK